MTFFVTVPAGSKMIRLSELRKIMSGLQKLYRGGMFK
jgi:hypothetical protein